MDYIKKFLDLYLTQKIKFNSFKLIINFFIYLIILIIIITEIEKTAYFEPYIKIKILNIILILSTFYFLFLIFKIIIHKYHLYNNSTYQNLATELIN